MIFVTTMVKNVLYEKENKYFINNFVSVFWNN